MLPSDPALRHADCSSMNALTSAAVRLPQPKIVARGRAAAGQEQPGHPPVALHGSGGQPAITDRYSSNSASSRSLAVSDRRRCRGRRDTQPAQKPQQRRQPARREPVNMPARAPIDQSTPPARAVVSCPASSPRSSSQPLTMRHQLQLGLRREAAVSQPLELRAEPVRRTPPTAPRPAPAPVLPITAPFVRSHDQTKEPRRDPPRLCRADQQRTPRRSRQDAPPDGPTRHNPRLGIGRTSTARTERRQVSGGRPLPQTGIDSRVPVISGARSSSVAITSPLGPLALAQPATHNLCVRQRPDQLVRRLGRRA